VLLRILQGIECDFIAEVEMEPDLIKLLLRIAQGVEILNKTLSATLTASQAQSSLRTTGSAIDLSLISGPLSRIADALTPPSADKVGTPYVAKYLGCTTVWVAEMARTLQIPKIAIVPGTGNGKPWKFIRSEIDKWLKSR
jgi:hypothetical protein